MYSATALAAGDLVAADLPDAITLLGVGSLSRSGTGYGDTTDGVIFETPKWARYIGGTRTTQSCLITGDGNLTPGDNAIEDQFAATYQINLLEEEEVLESVLVHRVSLCRWENAWQGFIRFNTGFNTGNLLWTCYGGNFDSGPGSPEYFWGEYRSKLPSCGDLVSSPLGLYRRPSDMECAQFILFEVVSV